LEDGKEKEQLLIEWGFENQINAVKNIKNTIEIFYKTQSSKNLKKRIDTAISQLATVLHNIISNNDCEKSRNLLDKKRVADAFSLLRESAQVRSIKLKQLQNELKKQLIDNKYFSIALANEITEKIQEIDLKMLEDVGIEVNQSATTEFHVEEVNSEIRKRLRKSLFEKYEGLVLDIATEKYEFFHNRILEIVLGSLHIDPNNRNFNELQTILSSLINQKSNGISYNKTSYVYLVERFSRDVFDILIKNPRGHNTRKGKYNEARKEFIALSTYESNFETAPVLCRPLIKKILGISSNTSIDDIKVKMEIAGYNKEILTAEIFDELIKLILMKTLPIPLVIRKLITKWPIPSLTKFTPKEILEKFKSKDGEFIYEGDQNVFDSLYDGIPRSETKEDLLEEINEDIHSLIDILKGPVVEALGMEKPFISTISKQIDKILDESTGETGPLDEFISEHIDLIKFDEYEKLKQEEQDIQHRIKIIADINDLLTLIEKK
jgi:hypothetical protein